MTDSDSTEYISKELFENALQSSIEKFNVSCLKKEQEDCIEKLVEKHVNTVINLSITFYITASRRQAVLARFVSGLCLLSLPAPLPLSTPRSLRLKGKQ